MKWDPRQKQVAVNIFYVIFYLSLSLFSAAPSLALAEKAYGLWALAAACASYTGGFGG